MKTIYKKGIGQDLSRASDATGVAANESVNKFANRAQHEGPKLKRLSYAIALALTSMMASDLVMAQDSKPATTQGSKAAEPAAPPKSDEKSKDNDVATIVVVGTRASQQSAIDRKKHATTALDSIVAEDVGAFPDRNIGEAISRISGISLDRGDFGEGVSVTVRGNGPDLTRVEIDGQAVQSAGGSDMNGGGFGRAVEFRQLSSDLIKSVDVVKGSTADMTEGALGGGIIITTRTGLDFKKPYASLRLATTQNSINKEWTPDMNLVLANKYLDGRLGVLLNVSASRITNDGHSSQISTTGIAGYARSLDFDNSPNKTFTFNPSTVSTTDLAATTPIVASPLTAGGVFNSETPMSLVSKSAAAKTKADCYAAFPALTSAQSAAVNGTTARNAAITQRTSELETCLNQWNDYTPSLVRFIEKRQKEERKSFDLRFDFKVDNNLSVYVKGSGNSRKVEDNFLTYGLGGLNINTASVLSPTYQGVSFVDSATGVRTAVPGSGYYVYDNISGRTGLPAAAGAVANVIPGSVVVDANHHVTKFTITDGSAGTDQIQNTMETKSTYLQGGGLYKNDRLKAEFFIADGRSDFSRADKRTSWSTPYGEATLSVLPNGLWTYSFPATSTFDQANPAQYAKLNAATSARAAVAATVNNPATPAYTIAQQPLLTQAPQISYSPKLIETEEKTGKLDLTYNTTDKFSWMPWLTQIKTGFNGRDSSASSWGGGGATIKSAIGTYGTAGYVPPVVLPTNNLRGSFVGCENTPGSLGAGGAPCNYGYVPNTNLSNTQFGTTTLTQAQFLDVITQSMIPASSQFMAGLPDRPANLINGWQQIDVAKAFNLLAVPNMNFNCMKTCKASDGNVYAQPVSQNSERTKSGYFMLDFEKDELPFGMEFAANFGVRYVNTEIHATGQMFFTSITKTASFDPANPTVATGVQSSTLMKNTSLDSNTTDILPISNLSLWVVPNKFVIRYNHAKTVSRPPISRLLPTGTCTYDERRVGAVDPDGTGADMGCTGTIGNPNLKAQSNINQNLSAEWYPNKDTMLSIGAFKQNGRVGPAIAVGKSNVALFSGTNDIDPVTGKKLSDFEFGYSTWENGPATTRKGIEIGGKLAFTFLPWYFKYTGVDFNYSKLKSSDSVSLRELISGDSLPPTLESSYTTNLSLWYDDGALSARIAYQARANYFTCIAGCGNNIASTYIYPNDGGGFYRTPYNPGAPNFKDATAFIDAKIGYRFKNGLELFAEARNLGLATTTSSQAQYASFANGIPSLNDYAYAGRRIMVGINMRN